MASLNDFIDPDLTTNDVLHSSGYAQAAGGASAGGLSMEQRRKMMYGRQMVGSYAQSQLGRRYGSMKARTADQKKGRVYDASADKFDDKAGVGNRRAKAVDATKVDTPSINRRQAYIEPPTRNYNPFG
ncbi:hypothetical protein A2707_02815 [Candidatus Saccharibacteria bacterium RIFCSPHIGHO2_01_FULL_45_15]|nr:MAG: hypothetical protein A2707_02815 [Candidatus Saccharibacteria bacterium RIFCSPHIGHO2_01_FULL_45_15]OGL27047.1 MAG: hypothetical protein A3C39_00665 [Candidatus Saccharibacteria bacterium RIFCSPHIGHO2_02_FULL_46_12]OGL31857.1 MAG: hypothetical protein A3E76_03405 [Candidatus Saccharibacteria bacterium RIFCSPHIGHO2_12_FULL_44_22]